MTEHELMLTSILNCRRVDLFTDSMPLTEEQENSLKVMKERRENGEPLQYILNECQFMGLDLFVDERALIPRPETEILVDAALECIRRRGLPPTLQILDLGTGSGNISIALSHHLPSCRITSVDVSLQALDVARLNALRHKINSIEFIREDMRQFLQRQADNGHHYDMIISNPPYVATDSISALQKEISYEPRMALDGGKDGLDFYRTIIAQAHRILKSRGWLFFEIGDQQSDGIKELLEQQPFYTQPHVHNDYTDTARVMWTQKK
jgi:release factor glutamine methyltransferase